MNDKCIKAIQAKNIAEGTPAFEDARDLCAATLHQQKKIYMEKVKDRICKLSKSDKQWWRLNRQLLNKKERTSAVPPLKQADGSWCMTSKNKANLLAETFASKMTLPDMREDQFVAAPSIRQSNFFAVRVRNVERELAKLKVATATGPDQIPSRILKTLAAEIALPLTLLIRRILKEGYWPNLWRIHHIIPIYKKLSVYDPRNYRGVHLTPVMSKVVERVIGNPLIAFLDQHGFGNSQWAYRKRSSARDLVLLCVSQWILAICNGKKIGAYLSDISGAFDRVYKDYMLAKLHSAGVADIFLDFLNSYLEPRVGKVAIDSVFSEVFTLENTIFQGTVLGPCLWNVFFQDVSSEASARGGQEAMFADDLNVFEQFDVAISNEEIKTELTLTQQNVHRWGRRNRVSFDEK